jgi:hypothetical protein
MVLWLAAALSAQQPLGLKSAFVLMLVARFRRPAACSLPVLLQGQVVFSGWMQQLAVGRALRAWT